MKQLSTLFLLFACLAGQAQSTETHNFTTYDTTISIAPCSICAPDRWNVRISRPTNMFKAGDADTASRPAIITMPGQGELGTTDLSKLMVFGPHYWLNNGWDGGVTLGNGKHYPILITVCYINNVYPSAPAYYNLLSFLLKTYHIKRNSVHIAGLSQGAFSGGALIQYEATAGDETGMKLVTTLTCLEGTPDPLPAPFSTWSRGFTAYQVWAQKYGGRYFYLEGSGSDNFRDGWQYANAMNAAVPGSAYFSYEKLGGGAHCCWNSMYDPNATNWTSVGTLGPNNAPSQTGTNQMGDYKAPSSIFQWMMKHGDSSLVGSGTSTPPAPVPPPTVNAGSAQTITLPTNSVTLTGTASETNGTIASYAWSQLSGPSTAGFGSAGQAQTTVNNLVAGVYKFQLLVTDGLGNTATATVQVTVNASSSSTSPPPTSAQAIPGKIEAESFNQMSGVDTEATTDAGGGKDVGWITAGDFMSYNVNVATAGAYTINFRVATAYASASWQLQNASGVVLANVTMSSTGGWQAWTTVSATATLPAGVQTLKIVSVTSGWNINWMQFTQLIAPATKAIPGTIQAENYDNMSGIATEVTTDAGGGSDVGWIDAGDFMSYNVNVATAGAYTVNFRVATAYASAGFQLQNASGGVLANVTMSGTGGWQAWTTVSATVTLPAGVQTLKLVSVTTGWNINWMQFVNTATAATAQRSVTAEALNLAVDPTQSGPARLDIYPNPASDNLILDIVNNHMGQMKVLVISTTGAVLKTYELYKDRWAIQTSISVNGLPAGMYLIRVQGSDWSETKKVLKK